MPTIVPRQTEISLVIKGNKNCLVTRTGAGQTQRGLPTTGTFRLSPIGVGDEESAVTADVPRSLHLYLPETLFRRLKNDFKLPAVPGHSIRFASGITDPVIQEIGSSILSALTNETAAGRTYVETAAMTLAVRLLLKHCDSGACKAVESRSQALDDTRLRRVLEYIAAHIDDDIRLESLAQVAGYSTFHFARQFAIATGLPPHRYISRMRLENAMAELADGTLPLAQIALNAHFSSQASFTRAFHRATGMTPRGYRYRR